MRSKQVIIVGASGVLVAVLVWAAAAVYPILTSGTMRFSIPEDFRGLIVLEAGVNGQSPDDWLQVPRDGIVRVDSMRPFRDWYQIEAKWLSGDPIQTAIAGRDNDRYNDVVFWELPLPGTGNRFYFFVGEFEQLESQWEGMRSRLYGVR